jgi:hypothetical protein
MVVSFCLVFDCRLAAGDWISVSGFNEEFQRDFARWRLVRQSIDQMLVSSLGYLGFSPGVSQGCPPFFASNVRTTRDGRRSRERANTKKDAAMSVVRNPNLTRSGLAKLMLAHPFSSCVSAATIAVTGSTLTRNGDGGWHCHRRSL